MLIGAVGLAAFTLYQTLQENSRGKLAAELGPLPADTPMSLPAARKRFLDC